MNCSGASGRRILSWILIAASTTRSTSSANPWTIRQKSPRFVETLSRRGYRFIAEVTKDGGVRGRAADASIAVLPFVNMSADAENEFFADGITEEIINVLSQIEQLHVAARTSSFFFKGKHPDMRQIGEQLNVRTVLEGSVRKVGDHLRITAQLVNVADGYHLWSERYDREMKDIFAIQDEIARSIAARLRLTLEGDLAQQLVRAGTRNLEAYKLYLKGRALLYNRGLAVLQARECFQCAVELDAQYAQAWAGVADCYSLVGHYGFASPKASMPRGVEAARRAIALDPSLAEAHYALAFASLLGRWDKAEAEHEFLRALELNPRHTQARGGYGFHYLCCALGRLADGVAQVKLAVDSDPLSSYAHAILGGLLIASRKYADALEVLQRAVNLDSGSFLARWFLSCALHSANRFDESIAAGEMALAMSGRHPWVVGTLATTFADCGKPVDAEALYEELVARARRSYVQPSQLAIAASAAGKMDEAVGHARMAFETRDAAINQFGSGLPPGLDVSIHWPYSARLHAYPRFRDLLSEVSFE